MKKAAAAILAASIFLLTGCLKKSSECPYRVQVSQAPYSEEQAIANYLTSNGLTATKHSSNMYYSIAQTGSGGNPNLCSTVTVDYTGHLTDGSVFDSQINGNFVLGSLIDGWKLGLPLIQKAGRIRLYIPPSLGYGSTDVKDGNGIIRIPANSILIFDIELTAF